MLWLLAFVLLAIALVGMFGPWALLALVAVVLILLLIGREAGVTWINGKKIY